MFMYVLVEGQSFDVEVQREALLSCCWVNCAYMIALFCCVRVMGCVCVCGCGYYVCTVAANIKVPFCFYRTPIQRRHCACFVGVDSWRRFIDRSIWSTLLLSIDCHVIRVVSTTRSDRGDGFHLLQEAKDPVPAYERL